MSANVDRKTVEGFGDEWRRFDQSDVNPVELREQFDDAQEQLREEHEEAQRANSEAGAESD